MSHMFTLQEAEEMLPAVERWLRSAMESKKSATDLEQQMNAMLVRINLHGGIQVNLEKVTQIKSGREHSVEQLKQALGEIEKSGVLVKDLDIGLLDFPTMLDDTEVYLCWKLGEPSIRFWHSTTEGFAGRKQIDQDFLQRHKGSRPH